MDDIIKVLVDNYIYVALGSVFLIILLIGVIVSGGKKKQKSSDPDMVSMSDVTTGTINEVGNELNNMNMQQGVYSGPEVNQPAMDQPVQNDLYAAMGNQAYNQQTEGQTIEEISEELLAPMGDSVIPSIDQQPVQQPVQEPIVENNTINQVFSPVDIQPAADVPVQEPVAEIPVVEPQVNENFGYTQEVPTIQPEATPVEPIPEIPTMEPVSNQFNEMPVVEPVEEIQPAVNNSVNEPEIMDFMDVEESPAVNTGLSVVDSNPLNGEAPNFEQNNN